MAPVARQHAREPRVTLRRWTDACCSCMPIPTTSASAPARPWPSTWPTAPQVTLVTCTLGEEGEVLLPELSHLASDQDDALGEHRRDELAAAMAELGVTDWRLLGGPGRFRDSGMIGTPPNDRPDCFWRTDLLVAAAELVPVIREVRPQVVVTYDDFGGYGHPDHIQAHRVTHYAIALAASPTFRAGPRPGVGRAEGLLDGLPAEHRPRGHRGAPGAGRRRRVHRHGPRRHPVRLRRRTRHHRDRGRASSSTARWRPCGRTARR